MNLKWQRIAPKWAVCVYLCWLATWCGAAWATDPDHIVERAWLADPSGTLTVQEVRLLPLQPYTGVFASGYGRAPVWFRLRIDPAASQARASDTLYLRMRPSYLDELVVYDPLQGLNEAQVAGDSHPVAATAVPDTAYVLPLPAGPGPRDVWVRLSTTSTRMVAFEVLTDQALRASQMRSMYLGALYLASVALMLVWSGVKGLIRPEPLVLSFTLYQGVQWLFSFSMLGYGRLFWADRLDPAVLNQATNVLGVLVVAAVMVFYHHLLQEVCHSPWVRRASLGLLGICPALLLGLLAAGEVSLALRWNMIVVALGPVWYGLLAWFSHPHPQGDAHWLGQRARYWVTAYFGLCTGLLYLTAWPGLGWITGLPIALYAVLVYALLTGALMLAMLQHRSHFQVKQQEQLAADARLAEHRAEQERATRLDREKLLAMLGHELKTPLAAMRMLLGHPGVAAPLQRPLQAAVTEMGQVVERTLEAGLVEDLARAVHLEVCDLAELVQKQMDALEAPERVQLAWPEPGTCHLHTDPQLLDIVLRNLLGNALKYSPADSMVRVHLNQHGTGWRLTVENHPGQAGLPDPGRVFEKYYRSPQARHRSGSGLGLYMVRALTEAMGGSITYEFRAGMACFVLILGAASKAPGRAE